MVERREKAVLLHNRRGFAPFLMCRECGCVPTCNHCSTALTYHERTHTAVSHMRFVLARAAVSRAHEPLPQMWQSLPAKWAWVRSRSRTRCTRCFPRTSPLFAWMPIPTRGKRCAQKAARAVRCPADCAVLLGTQMIAKGLDFPRSRSWAWSMPISPSLPDFRAGERALRLAGAGCGPRRPRRSPRRGDHPDLPARRSGHSRCRRARPLYLYRLLLDQRRDAVYPPFVRLVNILVWSTKPRRRAGLHWAYRKAS